jgi:hypothetical protein
MRRDLSFNVVEQKLRGVEATFKNANPCSSTNRGEIVLAR